MHPAHHLATESPLDQRRLGVHPDVQQPEHKPIQGTGREEPGVGRREADRNEAESQTGQSNLQHSPAADATDHSAGQLHGEQSSQTPAEDLKSSCPSESCNFSLTAGTLTVQPAERAPLRKKVDQAEIVAERALGAPVKVITLYLTTSLGRPDIV